MEVAEITLTLPVDTERLSPEDFETASIRSAAPSYTSEAPSYHSSFPVAEAIPDYAPRRLQASRTSASIDGPFVSSLVAEALPPTSAAHARANSAPSAPTGLPPIPAMPVRRHSDGLPDLLHFRVPLWSAASAGPAARHYQRVADRRVTAATNTAAAMEGLRRVALGRIDEDGIAGEQEKLRPLEDPDLVGEEAARRARVQRLARESGDDILVREDKRWDWFLGQMKDMDERNRTWKQFRREMENSGRVSRIARKLRS